jgi:pimeloyl-ACP methyl ester carboxylesterase
VKVAERLVEANGVQLCTEPFGDPADPPILLLMGVGGSMIWWEEGFCRMLAVRGRRGGGLVGRRPGATREVERAGNLAALQNHDAIPDGRLPPRPLSAITAPTLVVHGTADPMFPLAHGQALADEIPGARLLPLQDAGHGVDRADWATIIGAILDHTAPTDRPGAR